MRGQFWSYLRSYVALPREPNPPPIMWRDWLFVLIAASSAIIEGLLHVDVFWRPFTAGLSVLLAFLIAVRRSHAFLAGALTLIVINVTEVMSLIVNDGRSLNFYTSAYVLVLMYCVFRWGSGLEGVWMLVLMAAAWVVSFFSIDNTPSDIIGGGIVLLFPPLVGIELRFFQMWREQQLERVKSDEREQIARELHDTVAHHVSAIAIQAQAGLALADSSPEAAKNALRVVEEQASRTLTEMRMMVRSLRQTQYAELTPQAGIHDIARLDQTSQDGPRVQVELTGDLADLRPSVDAALYRLAQESITNASRHATNARTVRVSIDGAEDAIQLTVVDDGDLVTTVDSQRGFGIQGMTERTKLLGGSLSAGPNPDRGWTVNVRLPRTRVTT